MKYNWCQELAAVWILSLRKRGEECEEYVGQSEKVESIQGKQ